MPVAAASERPAAAGRSRLTWRGWAASCSDVCRGADAGPAAGCITVPDG